MRRVAGECGVCGAVVELYLDEAEATPKFCACPDCRAAIALIAEPQVFHRHPAEERAVLNCAVLKWGPNSEYSASKEGLEKLEDVERGRVRLLKMDYQAGRYAR